jgi:hypothetical protein
MAHGHRHQVALAPGRVGRSRRVGPDPVRGDQFDRVGRSRLVGPDPVRGDRFDRVGPSRRVGLAPALAGLFDRAGHRVVRHRQVGRLAGHRVARHRQVGLLVQAPVWPAVGLRLAEGEAVGRFVA